MKNFRESGLPETIINSLDKMGFTTPTPIQAQAIPLALQGRDILGSAQTGTGKTAAYAIPLVANLLAAPNSTALILTPTRELAMQVEKIMQELLGNNSDIRSVLLIGGDSMPRQVSELKRRPRLIVGTPGRINDHLTRGNLMLNKASFFVLDETDKMLDMGFEIQIDKIARYLPKERQTLMFSATMPDKITKMAQKYLNFPERITIGSVTNPIAKIKQEVIYTTVEEKYSQLTKQLDARSGTIIVFVKTKRSADKLTRKLLKEKHSADAIHGDLRQRQRERVILSFRNQEHRIMVATDVAARGLDIPHIEHVINYDLPQVPEDYIHRIGRTGRAGAEGSAICLITPDDSKKWKAIEKMLNPGQKTEKQAHTNSNRGGANNDNRERNRNRGRNRHRTNDRNNNEQRAHGHQQRSSNNTGRPRSNEDFGNLVSAIQPADGNRVETVDNTNYNTHQQVKKQRTHQKSGYKGKSFRFNDYAATNGNRDSLSA